MNLVRMMLKQAFFGIRRPQAATLTVWSCSRLFSFARACVYQIWRSEKAEEKARAEHENERAADLEKFLDAQRNASQATDEDEDDEGANLVRQLEMDDSRILTREETRIVQSYLDRRRK